MGAGKEQPAFQSSCSQDRGPFKGFVHQSQAFHVTIIFIVLTSGHIQYPFLVPTDVTRDLGSEPLLRFPCVLKKIGTKLIKERSSMHSLAQGGESLKSSPPFLHPYYKLRKVVRHDLSTGEFSRESLLGPRGASVLCYGDRLCFKFKS